MERGIVAGISIIGLEHDEAGGAAGHVLGFAALSGSDWVLGAGGGFVVMAIHIFTTIAYSMRMR